MSNFERGLDPKIAMGVGIEAEMLKWLKDNYGGFGTARDNTPWEMFNSYLGFCADGGKLEYVKYLIEKKKANIHTSDDGALRWSARNGHLDVVKYLVEHGADITSSNKIAIRWAREEHHEDVVKYLETQLKKQDKKWVREDLRFERGSNPNKYIA